MSPEEQKIKNLSNKFVEEAPYHPGYEDAVPQPIQDIGRKFDGGKLEYGFIKSSENRFSISRSSVHRIIKNYKHQ